MAEAFIYCWTDTNRNILYVGTHKGTPDDGYVCSGKLMLEEYNKRLQDFKREVMAFGSYNDISKYLESDEDYKLYGINKNITGEVSNLISKKLIERVGNELSKN